MMNSATKSFAISSLMALHFSSSKRHRCCFTGLEPSLIFKACSVTSLEMPGMFEGFHAKMSLLVRRKSTGVLSYSEESVVPMHTTLPLEPLVSMRTSLTPSIGSKDPADRLGSGASLATSFLMAASSLEAMIYCGVFTALDLALIGAIEGGADGDDPAWTRHLQL